MRRLDSGSSNHWFKVDHALRRLYYMEGGGDFVTRLGVVDLDDYRRRTYGFPHQKIIGIRPASDGDAVKLATEGTGESNSGEHALLMVDPGSGRVLNQEKPATLDGDALAFFGESARPEEPARGFAAAASTATRAGDDDVDAVWYKLEGGARPGVRTAIIRGNGRTTRFFPTTSEPNIVAYVPGGPAYVSYAGEDGWKIEEFRALTGARRPVATLPGEIESMSVVGLELVALHRTGDSSSPRALAMIDPAAGRVALDLPWSDGESDVLAADAAKRLLYVRMREGDNETCWAIHFDEGALRAASAYLARNRGSGVRKFTGSDALALGMTGGMLVLFIAILAVREA